MNDRTQIRPRERRFGPMGMALAAAGGFLAGVLLIAVLGGAQPVYKDRTVTRAAKPGGIAVPTLTGVTLDRAVVRLEDIGLKADFDSSAGGLFGIVDKSDWTVVGQDPSPGSRVSRGDSVHLDIDRA
ncbi:MAG TPA: PASTA domain-containing protein [Solirubrobacteraceae bacterium]|jgi:hypothetical protein